MPARRVPASGALGRAVSRAVWSRRPHRLPWVLALWLVLRIGVLAAESEPPPRTLTPALAYEGTALSNVAGGRRTGATYVGNLHLKLTLQGEALGHPGTSAFVDVLSIHGGQPSRFVGDAQGTSNIEGPVGTEFEEAWVQQNFRGSRFSVLAGLYDLNSEFYALQASGLFLNGSFGIGPEFGGSGRGGPSVFPRTSAGLRLAWKPTDASVLHVALLDGVPVVRKDGSRTALRRGDGALGVVEFAALSRVDDSAERSAEVVDRIGRFSSLVPYGDKLAAGVWRYTGGFDDLSAVDPAGSPARRRGSTGVYAIGERELVGARTSSRYLSGFFQAGVADPRTNRFGAYLGTGLVGAGWGPMRPGDEAGVAIALAVNGSHYQRTADAAGGAARAETTVELSYLTRVVRWLTVQPDLQYVVRPNTDRALANAWVLQCRFQLEFGGP